jgi:hypothetical protein
MIDLAVEVSRWRAAQTALRAIDANGGRNANTVYARAAHTRQAEQVITDLLLAGHRELAGELTGEAGLLRRLRPGTARPELSARLALARRRIKAAIGGPSRPR